MRGTRPALIDTCERMLQEELPRKKTRSLRSAVTQQIDDDQAYDDAVAQFIEDVDSKGEWTIS